MTDIKSVSINGELYYRPTETDKRVNKLLSDVYGVLWAEAHYDAFNESTRRFAEPICAKMQELNEILEFKK